MYLRLCHHNYRNQGLALDDTAFGNHGLSQQTVFVPNGASAGSAAVQFANPAARIRIATNPSWKILKAMRVQMLLRMEGPSPIRANLVEGHLAFAFFVESTGVLTATFFGPKALGGPAVWSGVSSLAPYSPDGMMHTVPLNQWVTVGFEHDGFANFTVSINGQVVGHRNDLVASVPSVGPAGVNFGNWPDGDAYQLHGMIDEVLIEKYDQDALTHEFTARPWTAAEANCWIDVLNAIAAGLHNRDGRIVSALVAMQQYRDNFLRQILKRGPAVQQRNSEYAVRFVELWKKGWLGTPEMERVLREWLCWLKVVVGLDLSILLNSLTTPSTSTVGPFFRGLDISGLLEQLGPRSCDADFLLFLKTLQRVLSNLKTCRDIRIPDHIPSHFPFPDV